MVEPPVVAPDREDGSQYLLLDGHLRISVLRDMGQREVLCLIAKDDEAFTYNRRINRLAIIQEHRMILKAIERGVPEERLARALNVDVAHIRRKRRLLDGICPEAADLLKDRHISMNALWELRKLKPFRQIEAAELMIAMNKFTFGYARSLVAASQPNQLHHPDKRKAVRGLSGEQMTLMERESETLERDFRLAEQAYGTHHLDLVLAKGYLARLLGNTQVVRYLTQHHPEMLQEFQKIAELKTVAA